MRTQIERRAVRRGASGAMRGMLGVFLVLFAVVTAGPALAIDAEELLDSLQRTGFDYFWNEANPANGLVKDRSTAGSPCSIAATGFGLSAICIGIDRGYVSREVGRARDGGRVRSAGSVGRVLRAVDLCDQPGVDRGAAHLRRRHVDDSRESPPRYRVDGAVLRGGLVRDPPDQRGPRRSGRGTCGRLKSTIRFEHDFRSSAT